MVQLSATRYSCIAILWVSLVSFAAITVCIASQRVILKVSVYFVIDPVRKRLDTPSYFSQFFICYVLQFCAIAALNEHHAMKALDGGEWSASRPCRFIPRERAPRTHWIGGWVGPRACLDRVVERKIPSPYQDSNVDYPARSPAL
jgi:hypothetical protein